MENSALASATAQTIAFEKLQQLKSTGRFLLPKSSAEEIRLYKAKSQIDAPVEEWDIELHERLGILIFARWGNNQYLIRVGQLRITQGAHGLMWQMPEVLLALGITKEMLS